MTHVYGYDFGSYQSFISPRREDAITQLCHSACQAMAQLYLLYKAWSFSRAKNVLKRPAVVTAFRAMCFFLGSCVLLSFAAGACVTLEVQLM